MNVYFQFNKYEHLKRKKNTYFLFPVCVCWIRATMRKLDISGMRVVHAGRTWPYCGVDPSTRQAMRYLERDESLITWVQPKDGCLDDQIPVIHLSDGVYYILSLRSMKVVFRHVRLHKAFVNRERTIYGEWKLRIPVCLLREKIRTQHRFNVMCFFFVLVFLYYCNDFWTGAPGKLYGFISQGPLFSFEKRGVCCH